jgi:hypothetical protein
MGVYRSMMADMKYDLAEDPDVRFHRSIGRTQAYLECLEIIRTVWAHLPDEGCLDEIAADEQLRACREALRGARDEMIAQMQELRDQIGGEGEVRAGWSSAKTSQPPVQHQGFDRHPAI